MNATVFAIDFHRKYPHTKFNKKRFQSNGAADAVEFYVQLRIRYGRLNEATKKHSKRKLNLKFEVAEKKWKN